MRISTSGAIMLLAAAVTLAGCQRTTYNPGYYQPAPQPAPLTPAPVGTVDSSQLPPPSQQGFPDAPQQQEGFDNQEMANLETGAQEVSPGAVAGVWSVNVAGQSCRVATPQTRLGQGYRAGPLRCPPPLDGLKSWNVAGKQLTFYDVDGNELARLYSSGSERFDGSTSTGQAISLSR